MSMVTVKLEVWRQAGPQAGSPGGLLAPTDVSQDMSFLEMLDVVNDGLIRKGDEPIAFDSDCREGICGSCGVMVNGVAHGPDPGGTVCQLHMRRFSRRRDDHRRALARRGFPVVKDLVVDRSAFDRIIAAGGYVSVNTGAAPEANAIPIALAIWPSRRWTRRSASAAARAWPRARTPRRRCSRRPRSRTWRCCRRARSNASRRVVRMVEQMDAEGFGMCSNEGECEAVCPKGISIANIAKMNREYFRASVLKTG